MLPNLNGYIQTPSGTRHNTSQKLPKSDAQTHSFGIFFRSSLRLILSLVAPALAIEEGESQPSLAPIALSDLGGIAPLLAVRSPRKKESYD